VGPTSDVKSGNVTPVVEPGHEQIPLGRVVSDGKTIFYVRGRPGTTKSVLWPTNSHWSGREIQHSQRALF
jgi:hypothetical protein